MVKEIICYTEKQEKEVLNNLEKQGYNWLSGHKPTQLNYFSSYNNYSLVIKESAKTIDFGEHGRLESSIDITLTAKEFLGKNECIVIYRKGSETVALDKSTGKKAVAKCSKDDTYDFMTGAKLAFDRLTDNTDNTLYNRKVVCVRNNGSDCYTVGKVYQFKDGKLKSDLGVIIRGREPFHSFEEWKGFSIAEWVELVE